MFKNYRQKIAASIAAGDKYDVYEKHFRDYKDYLEDLLLEQPYNTAALCQLGMVYLELREYGTKSISLLKRVLKDSEQHFSDTDKAQIYTNLAALYGMEMHQPKQEALYLKKALALCPNPLLDEKLGIACVDLGKDEEALASFKQAWQTEPSSQNSYHYALMLAILGQYQKALANLPAINANPEKDVVSHLSYYLKAFCLAKTGELEEASAMTDELVLLDEKAQELVYDFIAESEMADIYYLYGKYAKHNKMYDTSKIRYYYDASWLGCYFDSLYKLGDQEGLQLYYQKVRQEKLERLQQIQADDYSQVEGGEAARQDYLQSIQEELAKIQNVYQQVLAQKFVAQIKCAQPFLRNCYYTDCPRHSKELS